MSDVFSHTKELKKGEVLPITHEELEAIVEELIRCCNQHKVIIDHFGYNNQRKGRRRVARFGGTVTNIKTMKLTAVRALFGEQDEFEISPNYIWGVDRRGNLYADLVKQ